jgi:hypothetical protein
MMLALLRHHHAETLTDRAGFLGITGRGRTRTHSFEIGVGQTVDNARTFITSAIEGRASRSMPSAVVSAGAYAVWGIASA